MQFSVLARRVPRLRQQGRRQPLLSHVLAVKVALLFNHNGVKTNEGVQSQPAKGNIPEDRICCIVVVDPGRDLGWLICYNFHKAPLFALW
jgi:hypothetical protein